MNSSNRRNESGDQSSAHNQYIVTKVANVRTAVASVIDRYIYYLLWDIESTRYTGSHCYNIKIASAKADIDKRNRFGMQGQISGGTASHFCEQSFQPRIENVANCTFSQYLFC